MSKPQVIVIDGLARTGKDTVIEYVTDLLSEKGLDVDNLSSILPVKEAIKLLDWDGKDKSAEARLFMNEVKAAWTKYNEGPTNYLIRQIKGSDADLIFVHIREWDEISKFLKAQPGAQALLVEREQAVSFANPADDQKVPERYDYVLDNSGSLEDLRGAVEKFVEWLDF